LASIGKHAILHCKPKEIAFLSGKILLSIHISIYPSICSPMCIQIPSIYQRLCAFCQQTFDYRTLPLFSPCLFLLFLQHTVDLCHWKCIGWSRICFCMSAVAWRSVCCLEKAERCTDTQICILQEGFEFVIMRIRDSHTESRGSCGHNACSK